LQSPVGDPPSKRLHRKKKKKKKCRSVTFGSNTKSPKPEQSSACQRGRHPQIAIIRSRKHLRRLTATAVAQTLPRNLRQMPVWKSANIDEPHSVNVRSEIWLHHKKSVQRKNHARKR
jgi:hypothetical protein